MELKLIYMKLDYMPKEGQVEKSWYFQEPKCDGSFTYDISGLA